MTSKTDCPVCGDEFDRRIEGTVQRVSISTDEELCYSVYYDRICIHTNEDDEP